MSVEFNIPLDILKVPGINLIDTLTRVNVTKGKLTMRPSLIAGRIQGTSKPATVAIGAHAGYSMAIYNNDYEELFFRDYVPGRWDGASNITCMVICCLATTQTGGTAKDFKLQLSYENHPSGGTITTSTHDLTNNVTCAVNEEKYILHYPTFTIDWDLYTPHILSSDHLGLRLWRIAADGTAITGNVIVLDVLLTYQVDKVYKSV